ncbi:MAG: hypothetical protein QF371_04765, partial [Flavobacteriales bacterium]|nr:hypothetical protein [Flavobacteriales bacterium]
MPRSVLFIAFVLSALVLSAQSIDDQIEKGESRLEAIQLEKEKLLDDLEVLRLKWVREHIDGMGYPVSSKQMDLAHHIAI